LRFFQFVNGPFEFRGFLVEEKGEFIDVMNWSFNFLWFTFNRLKGSG